MLTAALRGRASLHLRLGKVGEVITCGVIHVMGADARIHAGHVSLLQKMDIRDKGERM